MRPPPAPQQEGDSSGPLTPTTPTTPTMPITPTTPGAQPGVQTGTFTFTLSFADRFFFRWSTNDLLSLQTDLQVVPNLKEVKPCPLLRKGNN